MPDDNNPYDAPEIVDAELIPDAPNQELGSGKATYNVVTDLVTGANLRAWDNTIQIIAILIATPLGGLIGYQMASLDRGFGALVGGFFGLLTGLFGSGIFLMIYRAVRHIRGKHD
jgi:hypothetical protein